ncbi:MAG: hypothetical protein JKX81_11035 [Arenicella sp.]|nr:hypothetical protein [Arenicella sp.]
MVSTKSVLPKLLKTLVITSMAFGSIAAYAGHHEEGEKKVGDLKDMKSKHSMKADKMHKEHDVKHSMTDEAKSEVTDTKENMDKAKEETTPDE